MAKYYNKDIVGIISTQYIGDGSSIKLNWTTAYNEDRTKKIAYNIYQSSALEYYNENHFFNNPPQFVSIGNSTTATLTDFTPGDTLYFGIRAVEYGSDVDPTFLQDMFSIKAYSQSLLATDLDENSTEVELIDASLFPDYGIIKVGVELIYYATKTGNVLTDIIRGYLNSKVRIHQIDGYDGFHTWNNVVSYWLGNEEQNTKVFRVTNEFDWENEKFIVVDGYHQKLFDNLNTDHSANEEVVSQFPSYDYAGYHRTNIEDLLNGGCQSSYFGGYQGCSDGYGVNNQTRGLNLNEQNAQRQEMLLETTGKPAVLLQRMWTGITNKSYMPMSEYQDDRMPEGHGTEFLTGFSQRFFERRSDGRILISIENYEEIVKQTEAGLESETNLSAWTLSWPVLKMRDIIILFDPADNEEFRYEVTKVSRSVLLNNVKGAQKFSLTRIRKTDPAYQLLYIKDTKFLPSVIQTSVAGFAGLPMHSHSFKRNESGGFNQMVGVSAGHGHTLTYIASQGKFVTSTILGHYHEVII